MSKMKGFIIFTDLKGYSRLEDDKYEKFLDYNIKPLAEELETYKAKAKVWNTWGDALIAVFEEAHHAVWLMLTYRKFFQKNQTLGLNARISGHYGEMKIFQDPLQKNSIENAIGKDINIAARIEPITFPGEIFVSKQFKENIEPYPELTSMVEFQCVGNHILPKEAGEIVLYRMFPEYEDEWNVNNLFPMTTPNSISQLPTLKNQHSKTIDLIKEKCYSLATIKEIEDYLSTITIPKDDGHFCVEIANLCKSFGFYEWGIKWADAAQNYQVKVGSLVIHPFQYDQKVLKIKSNSYTRLGDYHNAADITYGLWEGGQKNSDTLSMLAAQLKRKALSVTPLDRTTLQQSLDLYLEAFRFNGEDYYPAINAAYIQKILKKSDAFHLASYIANKWKELWDPNEQNWYLYCTLAETQLILEQYESAARRMEKAILYGKPTFFEKQAALEQIQQYLKIMNLEKEGENVVKLLQN